MHSIILCILDFSVMKERREYGFLHTSPPRFYLIEKIRKSSRIDKKTLNKQQLGSRVLFFIESFYHF